MLLHILVLKEEGCQIAIEKTLDMIGLGQKQHFGIGEPPILMPCTWFLKK